MPWLVLRIVAQAAATFLASTLIFDVVHVLLHAGDRAEGRLGRGLARLHDAHHDFLGSDLQVRDERWRANVVFQHLPEAGSVVVGTLALARLVHPVALVLATTAQVAMLVRRLASRGRDWHHRPLTRVLRPWSGWFVGRDYHALHHLHPGHFQGSALTLVDRVRGTSLPLGGRTAVVTGADTSLGAALTSRLEAGGAHVLRLDLPRDLALVGAGAADEALARADLLVLAHPVAALADQDLAVALVERHRALRRAALVVPEVWAVLPPDAGSGWRRVLRGLFHERTLTVRLLLALPGDAPARAARRLVAQAGRGARVLVSGERAAGLAEIVRLALRRDVETAGAWVHRRSLSAFVDPARPVPCRASA
ncbi:MAG: hypothetical protein H6732_08250 [Alphaproteobacteria bacterium]|nr:hypothetical protein [Alphaproteobacteria bacterium]